PLLLLHADEPIDLREVGRRGGADLLLHLRLDDPGRHRQHARPGRLLLEREALGQAIDGGLAGAVGRPAEVALATRARRDVDERAARTGGAPVPAEGRAPPRDTEHVDLDVAAPRV